MIYWTKFKHLIIHMMFFKFKSKFKPPQIMIFQSTNENEKSILLFKSACLSNNEANIFPINYMLMRIFFSKKNNKKTSKKWTAKHVNGSWSSK